MKTARAIGASHRERHGFPSNHFGLALPEVPFGGIKDSGYGTRRPQRAIEAYLNNKFGTAGGL